jgi:hypothetical protein
MFDSICIREQNDDDGYNPLDMGFLAEALLFYQQVRVVGSFGVLKQLVSFCGKETLFELLQRGYLKFSYTEQISAIQTKGFGGIGECHMPVWIEPHRFRLQNAIPTLFLDTTGRSGRSRRLGAQLNRLIELLPAEKGIMECWEKDFTSIDFLERSFRTILGLVVPEYPLPDRVVVDSIHSSGHVRLRTNIDFIEANQIYHKHVSPEHSSLSLALLLSKILSAKHDLYLSSKFNSEISTSESRAAITRLKVNDVINAHSKNLEHVSHFQDFIFDEARALREAINRGEKNFFDLLRLLDKAEKFKVWLKEQKADADLCKEYHRAVAKETWLDKLPCKSVRWSMFTGIGLGIDALGAGGIGTASGIAISAVDQFILDRLLKGWKPNQFIEGEMRNFLRK